MTAITIPLLVLAAFGLLALLLVHYVQRGATAEERKKVYREAAKELEKQAEILVERRTDADVVRSLRRKAADKRKREADSKPGLY